VVDDHRIVSMVQKNQAKRRFHESKYRVHHKVQTIHTPQEKKGQIRLCPKQQLKKPDQFWESILWMGETKMMLWVMIHSIPWWGKFDGMCMNGFQWHWVTGVYRFTCSRSV